MAAIVTQTKIAVSAAEFERLVQEKAYYIWRYKESGRRTGDAYEAAGQLRKERHMYVSEKLSDADVAVRALQIYEARKDATALADHLAAEEFVGERYGYVAG